MALMHPGPMEIQTSPGVVTVGLRPEVYYDAYSDELVFKLDPDRTQSFLLPVNDVVSLLYDDEVDRTIGVQIDDFATYAVHQYPDLAIIAKIMGVVPRDPDDTQLFREDRTVLIAQHFTSEDEARFKEVVRGIISYTGGFDSDITIREEPE